MSNEHRRASFRTINPVFHLSASGGPKTRKAKRGALLAETANAQRALQMAEYFARQLGLFDVERQIALSRGLVEGVHLEVRARGLCEEPNGD